MEKKRAEMKFFRSKIWRCRRNALSNVEFSAGRLTAIGYNEGREVCRHQIETTGRAVALKVEVETPAPVKLAKGEQLADCWRADGMDLEYLKIWAVDAKGRRVYDATGEVSVQVEGAATLHALDNADHYTDLLFTPDIDHKPLKTGFMQAILRSTREAGAVTVRVSCPGLKGATLKLMTR